MGFGVGVVVDAVGDVGEGIVGGVERGVGAAVGGAGRVVGSGLAGVGLDEAGEWVADAGDRVADQLGARVGERELGGCEDPADLVHGDTGRIRTAAARLERFAAAFDVGRVGLARLEPGGWEGLGAEAFRGELAAQPGKWARAAGACEEAASALEAYACTVDWARGQAAEAVRLWRQGRAAEPAARDTLASARTQRDAAGHAAASAIRAAAELAPAAPDFASRLAYEAGDVFAELPLAGAHFLGGVLRAGTDLVRFARGLNPLDPYNLTHPYAYVTHLDATAAGLAALRLHPERLPGLLLGGGWGSDGAEAGGRLLGNLLMVAATGGGAEAAALEAPWRDALPGRGTAGFDDIRATLRDGPDGLAPVAAADQAALEAHIPRNGDGSFVRHPDPAGSWARLQNDGGPGVPGRANNCADNVRAALETWYGNPQVAAPRAALEGPERGVKDNLVAWAGTPSRYAGEGAAAYDRVAHEVARAGHGSSALVTVAWHGRRYGHIFTALNHRGQVIWYDPQSGSVSRAPLHTDADYVWRNVLGPDRAPLQPEPNPQGGAE